MQLPLFRDTIDHICSFLFYTVTQSIDKTKQKYNFVFQQLKKIIRYSIKSHSIFHHFYMYHIQIHYGNKQLHFNMCGECGKYRKYVQGNPVSCQCYLIKLE
jgi:hypothetical protein